MTSESLKTENLRSQRLAAVIADFLQAGDRGEPPDVEAVMAAHPDLSDSLQGFFQAHRRLQESGDRSPAWRIVTR